MQADKYGHLEWPNGLVIVHVDVSMLSNTLEERLVHANPGWVKLG